MQKGVQDWEKFLGERGFRVWAGVDEAGRGPLAGPVVAAAVILPNDLELDGLDDSKVVKRERREILEIEIKEKAVAWAVGEGSVREIGDKNILEASRLAMQRAVEGLMVWPEVIITDAVNLNLRDRMQVAVTKGDGRCRSVMAASILAKVERDRLMCGLAKKYPQYGFEQNMGYGTKEHYFALEVHGPCRVHRKGFELEKKI